MRLIGLVVVLAISFTLAPLGAEAQQAGKMPRIGMLLSGAQPDPRVAALRQALRERGYVDGQNIGVEPRGSGDIPRLGRTGDRSGRRLQRVEARRPDEFERAFQTSRHCGVDRGCALVGLRRRPLQARGQPLHPI